MTTKILIVGGIVLFLYMAKIKRDKAKEDKVFQDALKNNEMPCEDKINQIILNLDTWIKGEMPFFNDDQRAEKVANLVDVDDYIEIEEA